MAKVIGYMCLTDFRDELPNSETYVYPSIEELKEKRPCVEECGIVEVEVKLLRVVQHPDWGASDLIASENHP